MRYEAAVMIGSLIVSRQAPRCAASGLDRGAPAEKRASMPVTPNLAAFH